MNQARVTLARRVVNSTPSMIRPALLTQSVRTALGRPRFDQTYGSILKHTADHGQEFLVLAMYFGLTCMLLCWHMIYISVFRKNEINCLPSNMDLNDQFSRRLDWTDPRGTKTMGPLTRRHVMFWENKLGWKDDLKDLLNEIYAFNKPGILKPSTIAVPSAFDGMSKSMILQEDQNKSTELMREALKEVLSEQ